MRAKERYEKVLAETNESRRKTGNLKEAKPINQLPRPSSLFLLQSMVMDVIGKSSGKLEPSTQEC